MMKQPERVSYERTRNEPSKEPEILSPFMALGNRRTEPAHSVQNYEPYPREHAQTFHGTTNNSRISDYSSIPSITVSTPPPRTANNPFDIYQPPAYSTSYSSFSKPSVEPDRFRDKKPQGG
jgi:hypothetical protein